MPSNDTTFVYKSTIITSAWANDINDAIFHAIGTGVGGSAPTTPGEVLSNLGLTSAAPPSGASLIGLDSVHAVSVQGWVADIEGSGGAAIVGFTPGGDLQETNVQGALIELDDEKASLLHGNIFTVGQQFLEYDAPATSTGADQGGWVAIVHKVDGGSNDNITPLIGHGHHDGAFASTGGIWGVVTEAWSNALGQAPLIGGEFACISQYPQNTSPILAGDFVFKNRRDGQTRPVADIAQGSRYNVNSFAIFISSQTRPSNPTYAGVGSGWQTAIRVGDNSSPGLDWEGGSFFPGSDTYKAYSTVIDMTGSLHDLAGGVPWFALYRNSDTYWGMRFNGTLTEELNTYNITPVSGGGGYVVGDTGTITGGSGTATYSVRSVTAGVVNTLAIINGGSGYKVSGVSGEPASRATTTTTGAGAGLTVAFSIGVGLIYGADIGISAVGAGYVVGELIILNGGTAGFMSPVFKVTTITAGAVTGVRLQSDALTTAPGTPKIYTNGRGHTVGAGKTTTSLTGVGAGCTLALTIIHDDLLIGGERWEFWRMLNPGDAIGTGARHGYIDSSYPGTPATIDTSGATYTFPVDRPM